MKKKKANFPPATKLEKMKELPARPDHAVIIGRSIVRTGRIQQRDGVLQTIVIESDSFQL